VETFDFDTIRQLILTRPTKLDALIRESFPVESTGDSALTFALEFHIRSVPGFSAMDGWKLLRIAYETSISIRVVGVIYLLPTDERVLEVEFNRDHGSACYRIRVGIEDAKWRSLSDSKRWNAVYLYSIGKGEEQWVWSEPILGMLTDA
jgi:hypothetical protein